MELTKQIGVLRNRKTLDGRKADRNKVNLEYWNFNENLGDLLAPVVTQWMLHRLGLDLYREAAKPCHLMTIGSVLGLGVFDAVIWGSGVNSFCPCGTGDYTKGIPEAGYPGSQRSGHRTGAPGERIYLSADIRRPGDPAASDLSRQTTGEKEKICGDRPLHEAENDRR